MNVNKSWDTDSLTVERHRGRIEITENDCFSGPIGTLVEHVLEKQQIAFNAKLTLGFVVCFNNSI